MQKDSIQKLRQLREDLCKKQQVWQEAFAIRDKVIFDLVDVYRSCVQKGTRKKQIEKKILAMFEYLDIDPNNIGGDDVSR